MGTISVRFDDRLQTVLRQPANDARGAAVRWRQLVDLIARAGPGIESERIDEALHVITQDSGRVDEALRAATARAIAGLALPPALLAHFVTEPLSVSAPILAAAKLEPEHWKAMVSGADNEVRAFVTSLHPYLVERIPSEAVVPAQLPRRSIGEVVERIERRRRPAAPASVNPAPSEATRIFQFECGPRGEIAWVEGAMRGALVGRSLVQVGDDPMFECDRSIGQAIARRAPFSAAGARFRGPSALVGEWEFSGLPSFDPSDGRFLGYRGVARRPLVEDKSNSHASALLAMEPASLRELVHELRTPLNAILGFSEIIDGQFLGPAGRSYRQMSNSIAAKARLLLGAIEDLDLAARMHAGEINGGATSDLGGIANRAVESLRGRAAARDIAIDFPSASQNVEVRVVAQYCARLMERLLGAVIDMANDGETIRIALSTDNRSARLTVSCPLADEGQCGPDPEQIEGDADSSLFGGLFSVRLVSRLAALADGSLGMARGTLILDLPKS